MVMVTSPVYVMVTLWFAINMTKAIKGDDDEDDDDDEEEAEEEEE